MRLWPDSMLSSLILQFWILWAKSIDAAVMSIQVSPVGPEYVGPSFSFIVSRQCEDKKSASILPLLSVVGLCRRLCLLYACMPQTKFLGFTVVRKVSMGVRSCSRVSQGAEVRAGYMDWGVGGRYHSCVVGIWELVKKHDVMGYVSFDEQGGSRVFVWGNKEGCIV